MAFKHFNTRKYGTLSVWYRHTNNYYVFSVGEIITEDEAMIVQRALHFAPEGYHFYDFVVGPNGTEWKCWDNCD